MLNSTCRKYVAIALTVFLVAPVSRVFAVEQQALAMLTNASGTVEYSADGVEWSPVKNNKLAMENYTVRTAKDGAVKILVLQSGELKALQGNSLALIKASGVELKRGSFAGKDAPSEGLFGSLKNKFADTQKYTVVRRDIGDLSPAKFRAAALFKISKSYPEIVWENPGDGYSFVLTVDKSTEIKVPQTMAAVVRVKLDLPAGQHLYALQVFKDGKSIDIPLEQRSGSIEWLNTEQDAALQHRVSSVSDATKEDPYSLGLLLDSEGFAVAAMDYYEKFFALYPNEQELKPPLLDVYSSLMLKKKHLHAVKEYSSKKTQ